MVVVLVSATAGVMGAFTACTDSYHGDQPSGSGTGPSNSGSGGGDAGAGGSIFGMGGGCEESCSNDLKKVVNCLGTVIKECLPEEGCANATCIPNPCDAAEKSKSSYGCDYWALKPAQRREAAGACFAAFVANTWSKPVHLAVERQGSPLTVANFAFIPQVQGGSVTYNPYDPEAGLGVGEVAILFLSRGLGGLLACPSPSSSPGTSSVAVPSETGVPGTGLGKAFRITSDYPVVAYQIAPYGGGGTGYTSATLLLPTSSWDTNYIAINAYKGFAETPEQSAGRPSLTIVAREDMTEITLLPNVKIEAGTGVAEGAQDSPFKYMLNAGEFLQIAQEKELTGSPVGSSKPIGVFGGSTCMRVPGDKVDCDSAHQQIAPVRATGNEYVAVRYAGRNGGVDEAPPWRMVGMVDGTELTWEPSKPAGAPSVLKLGEVVEFAATGPFVARSQGSDHPFYLGAYMTGGVQYGGEGDPEWVNVIPPQQFLDNYVFFTDPTYPQTSLVVVRARSKVDNSFDDVKLDCLGVLEGWQKVGNYEYTRVQLVSGNFQGNGECENGRHVMSSKLPFGVTVWGWGTTPQTGQVSYAYPAGAGFQPINQIVIPPSPR